MSKKYKLIKEYPNSPKLGSVIIDTNPNNGAKDCWFSEDWGKSGSKAFFIPRSTNPEKHPEFWELVKEKEWEIVQQELNVKAAFLYDGFTIKSIRRLSDNEVFSTGDKIEHSYLNALQYEITKTYTIEKIYLLDNESIRFYVGGGLNLGLEKLKKYIRFNRSRICIIFL